MNLLAHLHVGDHLPTVAAAANLTADFCRDAGCCEFQRGRAFHQRIDAFTDSHQAVLQTHQLFDGGLRRFSPVILDLVFDHCLSNTWDRWGVELDRARFIDSRLGQMRAIVDQLPTRAGKMVRLMDDERWLHDYAGWEGIEEVICRIVERRPRFAPMRNAIEVVKARYKAITESFVQFYPSLLDYARGL